MADWDNTGIITEGSKAEHIIPYVTFKAEEAQTFKMTTTGTYEIKGLEYSVNNGDWATVEAGTEVPFGGDKGDLRLRGTNTNGTADNLSLISTIEFTEANVNVACTGDIRTLLDWRNYNKVETGKARFCGLFFHCSVLTSAPELPATKLADFCYNQMFSNCTNLVSAPVLPATTLADFCYYYMFNNCKKLSTVTMLAIESEITSKSYCVTAWLKNAGTDASSRTLKVQDAAAYSALEGTGDLPDIWKKGAANTTVLNKDNGEIE